MVNLKAASRELFNRNPDERFETLDALTAFCLSQKERSLERWHSPQAISVAAKPDAVHVEMGSDGAFALNDWSFSQLCRLAGVQKDTLNRLCPDTASRVFRETLPQGRKPIQVLTESQLVRSIHSTQYARLWNADLIEKRKHTGNVGDGLSTIREIIAGLVTKRDERKDGFSAVIQKAMQTRLGDDADECLKVLANNGLTRSIAQQAIEYAGGHGGYSIWSLVDAITRISGQLKFIGLRTETDARASQLLALAV